jgi:hypothetical protein
VRQSRRRLAQAVSIAALVPPLGISAVIIIVPVLNALGLFLCFGTETRGLDLRQLERRQLAGQVGSDNADFSF